MPQHANTSTRKGYLEGKVTHAEYYLGIAESAGLTAKRFSKDLMHRALVALRNGDLRLNTIPLPEWDMVGMSVNDARITRAMRERGDYTTLSGLVSLVKTVVLNASDFTAQEAMLVLGAEMDHHETDLYVRPMLTKTGERAHYCDAFLRTKPTLFAHLSASDRRNTRSFRADDGSGEWLEIPFAYNRNTAREVKWIESTPSEYDSMLGVLPPEWRQGGGFLVGEASDYVRGEARFAAFLDTGEQYLKSDDPLTVRQFCHAMRVLSRTG